MLLFRYMHDSVAVGASAVAKNLLSKARWKDGLEYLRRADNDRDDKQD